MISLKVGHKYVLGSGDVIKIVSNAGIVLSYMDEQGRYYTQDGIHDREYKWKNVVSEYKEPDRDEPEPEDDEDDDDSDDDFELPDLTGPSDSDDDFEAGGGSFGGGGSDGDW